MYTARHRVHVDAPVDHVLEFIADPRNHVKMTPGLLSIEPTTAGDVEGNRWRGQYLYTLAGIRLEGVVKPVERDIRSGLIHELSGAVDGYVRAMVEEMDDGSVMVEYSTEYDLPETVLTVLPEATAMGYVSRDLHCSLANLKTHLEATEAVPE